MALVQYGVPSTAPQQIQADTEFLRQLISQYRAQEAARQRQTMGTVSSGFGQGFSQGMQQYRWAREPQRALQMQRDRFAMELAGTDWDGLQGQVKDAGGFEQWRIKNQGIWDRYQRSAELERLRGLSREGYVGYGQGVRPMGTGAETWRGGSFGGGMSGGPAPAFSIEQLYEMAPPDLRMAYDQVQAGLRYVDQSGLFDKLDDEHGEATSQLRQQEQQIIDSMRQHAARARQPSIPEIMQSGQELYLDPRTRTYVGRGRNGWQFYQTDEPEMRESGPPPVGTPAFQAWRQQKEAEFNAHVYEIDGQKVFWDGKDKPIPIKAEKSGTNERPLPIRQELDGETLGRLYIDFYKNLPPKQKTTGKLGEKTEVSYTPEEAWQMFESNLLDSIDQARTPMPAVLRRPDRWAEPGAPVVPPPTTQPVAPPPATPNFGPGWEPRTAAPTPPAAMNPAMPLWLGLEQRQNKGVLAPGNRRVLRYYLELAARELGPDADPADLRRRAAELAEWDGWEGAS